MGFEAVRPFRSVLVLVVLSSAAGLLGACGGGEEEWKAADVCFRKEIVGATGGSVHFTPVRCSAPDQVLGKELSTDFAKLRFKDLNGDGRSEAIVESPALYCRYVRSCWYPERHVLSLDPKGDPPVRVLSQTYVPELDQKNVHGRGS